MVGRSVDVSLRIKAQDEASKAIDAVGKALQELSKSQAAIGGNATGVSKYLGELEKNFNALTAVYDKLDRSVRQSNSVFEQQAAEYARLNAAVDQRKRKIAELQQAEEQAVASGRKRSTTLKDGTELLSVSAVQQKLAREVKALNAEQSKMDGLITTMAAARTTAMDLAAVQARVSGVVDETTAAYLRLANALESLDSAAAKQASRQQSTALRDRINATTGVGRGINNTGLRDQRANDLAATFAPVLAREEAQAVKEAAEAHKLFEQRVREGKAAMDSEAEAFAKLQQYARDVAEALDPVARNTRLVAEEESRLDAAVKQGLLTNEQKVTSLNRYRAALDGTSAATEREKRDTEALNVFAQELRRNYDANGYAAKWLAEQTDKLNRAREKGIIKEHEYAKALDVVKRKSEQLGENANPQMFGLNPYQTQNLLFQVNDVVTQLASGTSLMQTLAQQGGQIVQIFPTAGNAIAAAFTKAGPAIALTVATLGSLYLGIKRAADEAQRMREFEGVIAASASGSDATAAQLAAVTKELKLYGVAVEEAIKTTKSLYRDGFNIKQIEQFSITAKDMADVLGIDYTSAVKMLTSAYSGNWEAMQRLIDDTGAFTLQQRALIKELYAQGKGSEAAKKAFEILSDEMSDGANLARGSWAEAFRALGNAWDNLVEQFSKSWWAQAALDGINALADGLNYLAGASDRAADAEARRLGRVSSVGNGFVQYKGDPLAQAANAGAPINGAPATTDQLENAEKLSTEMRHQAVLSKEVTSQKILQQKLDVLAEKFNLQYSGTLSDADLAAQRQVYLGNERLKLEKQLADYTRRVADENKRIADEKERQFEASIKGFVNRTAKVESSDNPNATNPNSSATGLGQFVKGTWLALFKKYYADEAQRMTDDQILALRKNADLSKAMIEAYARENAEVLKKAGVAVTEANLYLMHLLGPSGGPKVIKANAGTALSDILPANVISANASLMRGKTAGDLRNYVGARFPSNLGSGNSNGSTDQALEAGRSAIADAEREREIAQREFNKQFDIEIELRNRALVSEKELQGLQGLTLENKRTELAIQDEIYKKTQELRRTIKDDTAELTQDQVRAIRDSFGEQLSNRTTAALDSDLQRKMDELSSLRDTLSSQIDFEYGRGNNGFAAQLEERLAGVNSQLLEAIENYRTFLNTPGNAEALGVSAEKLAEINLQLDGANERTVQYNRILGQTTDSISNAFTNAAVNAIDQFTQAIDAGKNAFGALWTAFRSFAANFLQQIAQMIQQQIIFNMVSAMFKAFAGATVGNIDVVGGLGAPIDVSSMANNTLTSIPGFHKGGIAGGTPTFYRSVPAALFANAMRYHTGGIAGLKPGEVPSILQAGEEILTRADPRHVMNGGGAAPNIKIVNAFDESDFITKALNTRQGEQALLNMIRNNPGAVKAALG